MARKKKQTEAINIRFSKQWMTRLEAVADHPRIEDSIASVVRDCVERALPEFELSLGIEVDDVVPAAAPSAPAPVALGWGPDRSDAPPA